MTSNVTLFVTKAFMKIGGSVGQIADCKGHSIKRLLCVRTDLVRFIAQASRWADRQVDGWVDKLEDCSIHVQGRVFQTRARE